MKVYSVNKGIGYASSGVEYAQKYRKELFEDLDIDDKYIFLNYLSKNITVYSNLLGYQKEQIIWIYNFLSHRSAEESSFTVEKFLEELEEQVEVLTQNETSIEIKVSNTQRYKIWLLELNLVDRVDYFVNGSLVSVSHYDKTLNNVEEYHQGKLVKRTFFDLEGNKSYEQFYSNKEITVTFIDNQILYGKMAFYQYFFNKLELQQEDAVIIDRPLDVVEGIVPLLVHQVRLFSVVHAEHYNENLSEGDHILWNNNYEYIFEHADAFEAIIVATERQNQILSQQLRKKTMIKTIPVGYIEAINRKRTYKPYSLITASRLATEKHIDILIKAVAAAREVLPRLTLDVYGEGAERNKLEEIIQKLEAESFIKLCGHKDLKKIYSNYSGYVSASTSEGFGLSLLEAIGEALPLIGVDVEYGNREFIENGKNGILFEKGDLKAMPEVLSKVIISFYDKKLDQAGRAVSRKKAKPYLKQNVTKKWQKLLEKEGNS
ncbi:Poly(glycerol-phosphate) alpha-glucosyltransferase GftA [Lactococcus cremoris]|uniref:Poly(Glycerol-phosphate) alpha-glucosyltransferase GftA n=1 Tax=Lactococcus lactis subsp. cremoris TaxID=1359 RepID=A0A166KKD6_LACLC|nr:glycosyltransferase [Lactococcus cremoris]KZK08518.1 Poly(glycerol-phosphate) alpha-glucosyltransferase GftA [Lactococcus cremoris]